MHYGQTIIEPVISEKAVLAKALSRYVFKVHPAATKVAISQAVEKLFKVNVVSVNTVKVRAKRKSMGRSVGRTANWKKAYVTLKPGEKIEELEA